MVLVVLAVAWGAVLVFWVRNRSQGGAFNDSVGLFHRHLRVLERTAPVTLAPANRMRGPVTNSVPLAALASPTRQVAARRLPAATRPGPRPVGRIAPVDAAAARRRESRRRRRDVLFGLTSVVLLSMVAAVGTGSHLVLLVQLASDAAFVAYVALLVRLRNLAAERDMKLRVLHRPVRPMAYGAVYGDLALRRAN